VPEITSYEAVSHEYTTEISNYEAEPKASQESSYLEGIAMGAVATGVLGAAVFFGIRRNKNQENSLLLTDF